MADKQKADSFMVDPASSPTPPTPQNLTFFKVQHILRGLAVLFTAVSIAILVTNHQTVTVFMMEFQAHFYYSSAFKFLVAADAIVCASSVVTLILVVHLEKRKAIPQRRHYCFLLFLHDSVMMALMMGGCAAGTAIGYVGQYGESHMGWGATCDSVPKFCRLNVVSLLFSYLAFFAYFGLSLLSPVNFLSSSSFLPPN
ncbi:CASP-like protein 1F2 [Prosopis cineraria]|uniref:CASP-like protein 1F2 n=1 Tax=Prosopis cineraria TaxID=364024 RepID=UPI0024107CB0|nr:CASP-like protein 1F2 [Prosopis cineraria]